MMNEKLESIRRVMDKMSYHPTRNTVRDLVDIVDAAIKRAEKADAERDEARKERDEETRIEREQYAAMRTAYNDRDDALAMVEDCEYLCERLLSGDTGCVDEAITIATGMRKRFTDSAAAAASYRARVEVGVLREMASTFDGIADDLSRTRDPEAAGYCGVERVR